MTKFCKQYKRYIFLLFSFICSIQRSIVENSLANLSCLRICKLYNSNQQRLKGLTWALHGRGSLNSDILSELSRQSIRRGARHVRMRCRGHVRLRTWTSCRRRSRHCRRRRCCHRCYIFGLIIAVVRRVFGIRHAARTQHRAVHVSLQQT